MTRSEPLSSEHVRLLTLLDEISARGRYRADASELVNFSSIDHALRAAPVTIIPTSAGSTVLDLPADPSLRTIGRSTASREYASGYSSVNPSPAATVQSNPPQPSAARSRFFDRFVQAHPANRRGRFVASHRPIRVTGFMIDKKVEDGDVRFRYVIDMCSLRAGE